MAKNKQNVVEWIKRLKEGMEAEKHRDLFKERPTEIHFYVQFDNNPDLILIGGLHCKVEPGMMAVHGGALSDVWANLLEDLIRQTTKIDGKMN
jgi:hypothetical protein